MERGLTPPTRSGPAEGGFDVSSDRTLWTLAEHWATVRTHVPALVTLLDYQRPERIETVTWGDFIDQTWELRRRLAGIGVADQRAVVLVLSNSPVTIALWLAIQANGAIVQAIDPDSGRLMIERAIAATGPVAVLAEPGNVRRVKAAIAATTAGAKLIVVSPRATLAGCLRDAQLSATVAAVPDAAAECVAGLLPTSGTSGEPKLVQLTHRNYVMSGERLARNGGYVASDRHYLCSPFFHTNAQLYICAPPLVTGGSIAIVPRFSATHYFDAARLTGATVASMVAPPMRMALHKAIERGSADPGALRLIQYGMQLSTPDWAHWDRLVPQIAMRQIYGQTESVTGVLGGASWENDDRQTIGRPFVGVEAVRIVGGADRDVPDGTPGELWVKGVPGSTLMRGYFNAPEATEDALVDGRWLRTGDIMVRHPGGRLEFRGRGMHIIRRGGENLSTYALELDLQSCPLVDDVAVAAQADATLDAAVVAHVIPGPGFEEDAFRAWCLETLGKRGVPDYVRLHTSFPRTGSGRVITRELT